VVSGTDPHGPYSWLSRPDPLLFLPRTQEVEWVPFQAHYFSENVVPPRMEHGTSGSVARSSDH
jgi:hypothetical protein